MVSQLPATSYSAYPTTVSYPLDTLSPVNTTTTVTYQKLPEIYETTRTYVDEGYRAAPTYSYGTTVENPVRTSYYSASKVPARRDLLPSSTVTSTEVYNGSTFV